MPIINDTHLYNIAKEKADEIYKKSSAYKSGYTCLLYTSPSPRDS